MVSIVIPAYNEEAVIGRALACLLDGAESADLEVIVCCNGCTDRTAEVARAFGPPVRVLETSKGSKILALNMGDAAATTFPRIYLDADVLINYAAVRSIVRALDETDVLAAAPRMRVDYSARNWAIRAFYEIWLKTPYHLHGMIGTGIYALSREGRSRFAEFPDIIADDGFVDAQFAPHERKTLEDCTFTIVPPKDLLSLIRIQTRSILGTKELHRKFASLTRQHAQSENSVRRRSDYVRLAIQPALWPKIALYTSVKMIAAIRARRQLKQLNQYCWERDESSRQEVTANP